MRHVLIDYARQHRAEKRGGGVPKQELDESAFPRLGTDEEGFRIAGETLSRTRALRPRRPPQSLRRTHDPGNRRGGEGRRANRQE